MSDFCYACDGTGERDWLSGAPCFDCNGTGWREDRDEELTDDEMDFWDEFYREQETVR